MKRFIYLSNAESGTISRYQQQGKQLIHLGNTDVGNLVMPMVVSRDGHYLYAALHQAPYCIVRLAIDPKSGDLTELDRTPQAVSMVNLDVDHNSHWLLSASFDHNMATLNRLEDDGSLGAKNITIPLEGHCHAFNVSPDNQWLVATEFGQDRVNVYRHVDDSDHQAALVHQYSFARESGPRHLVFSACGQFIYVLCEMIASVNVFAFDSETGAMTLIDEVEAAPLEMLGLEKGLPPEKRVVPDVPRTWAADIQLSADGRYLYVSERTTSIISRLEITANDPVPRYSGYDHVVTQPRSFALTHDGQYLLASGELSDHLALYQIDAQTGQLNELDRAPCGANPAWVSVVDFP
ncbi:lactonase family protein [Vibrio mytili]|uniref:lactonase family protein n=1 Tax=Vibrio mytili TaxID=50718 RepID=UPI003C6EBDED